MNLSKLIHEVWKNEKVQNLGLRKSDVAVVIKVFADIIVRSLLNVGTVKIEGLFTLIVKKAKGRTISNPKTRELMEIDDYLKIKINPSKRLKDGLREISKK